MAGSHPSGPDSMSGSGQHGAASGDPVEPLSDPQRAAQDWITLWQSELAALVTDRETQEQLLASINQWALAARSTSEMLASLAPRLVSDDRLAPRPRTDAPSRTKAAAPSSDARDDALDRLGRRIEALERRLAQLERRD